MIVRFTKELILEFNDFKVEILTTINSLLYNSDYEKVYIYLEEKVPQVRRFKLYTFSFSLKINT
jgi:hypothetical protein